MRGTGRAVFIASLLLFVGVLNIVYGIGALGNAHVYAGETRLVFDNLNTYGWVLIILGALQLTGGLSLFAGNTYGRVIGIIAASLGALANLVSIGGNDPWWRLAGFALCVYILWGLLLDTGCLPSAPLSGGVWRVLRLAGSAFVPVGKPIAADDLVRFRPGPVNRVGTVTQILPDTLQTRVWTGYFFVDVSLRINWSQGSFAMAQRCYSQTGRGFAEDGCEVPAIRVDRTPVERDLTFVRLFTESRETTVPEHVVIKRDSRVEFLAAKVLVTADDSTDVFSLTVSDDIWLKVRIDGTVGWIHTLEDFSALGIHQSG